jgi:predicted KAP-like P-loop ATPase
MIVSDEPLRDEGGDKLGISALTKVVARLLIDPASPKSLVVGISGPWGSGKTSCAQLVINEVNRLGRTEKQGMQVRKLELNPWFHAGKDFLVRSLVGVIGEGLRTPEDIFHEGVTALWNLGQALLTKWDPSTRDSSRPTPGAWQAKKTLERVLRERAGSLRIVVFLDDIDRLASQEIRELFWLLKTVTDLPSVYYVLMYYREAVVTALDEFFPGRGTDYLDRIVNLPIDLPPAEAGVMHGLFVELLSQALDKSLTDDDRREAAGAWDACLGRLVSTLRHAKRLSNAIHVARLLRPTDSLRCLLGTEGLRVLLPAVSEHVHANRSMFLKSGVSSDQLGKLGVDPSDQCAAANLLEMVRVC